MLNTVAALNQLNTRSALLGVPFAASVSDKAEQALSIALSMIAEQQRRITQLEGEVMTDAMTGLMNRRGFMRALEREMNRAARTGVTNCVLVMLDLDGLKQVNDTHGHAAGDEYIAGFTETLRRTVRGTDYIARLGGDEFAILLTDIDATHGWQRVETIARALNKNAAVSHGAALVQPGMEADVIMNDADKRLYECKTARKTELRKELSA